MKVKDLINALSHTDLEYEVVYRDEVSESLKRPLPPITKVWESSTGEVILE